MRSRAVRNYNSNSSAVADDARARGRRVIEKEGERTSKSERGGGEEREREVQRRVEEREVRILG